jgi:hypothetical protein
MASIRATARAAARKGFAAAGDALVRPTLRLLPVLGAYDPATDTTPTTWGFEQELDALEYDDVEEQAEGPEKRLRSFLFLGEFLVVGGQPIRGEQEGEIELAGLIYAIKTTETDPTGTVWIFGCEQHRTTPPPTP